MNRIYHPWTLWECFPAGFYATKPPVPMTSDDALHAYAQFLSDLPRFEYAMQRVTKEWPHSCDQFLTNDSLNRVAWLGQSSMCIATGVPACYRGGFKLLSNQQQERANACAQAVLEQWLAQAKKRAAQSAPLYSILEKQRLSRRYPGRSAGRIDATQSSAIIQGDMFRSVN